MAPWLRANLMDNIYSFNIPYYFQYYSLSWANSLFFSPYQRDEILPPRLPSSELCNNKKDSEKFRHLTVKDHLQSSQPWHGLFQELWCLFSASFGHVYGVTMFSLSFTERRNVVSGKLQKISNENCNFYCVRLKWCLWFHYESIPRRASSKIESLTPRTATSVKS